MKAKAKKCQILGYYFQSKLADLIQRNQNRTLINRIPEKGIRETHAKMIIPQYYDRFNELYYVQIKSDGDFVVKEW